MKINKFKTRAMISLTLTFVLIIIIISGIDLILVEQGRILDNSETWRKIHVFSAIGMTLMVIFHLTMNFKILIAEIKKLRS